VSMFLSMTSAPMSLMPITLVLMDPCRNVCLR
jgi:hypothetical protein